MVYFWAAWYNTGLLNKLTPNGVVFYHGVLQLMQAAEEFAASDITLAVQVELDFSLKDWDEGTLDDMGCYTPQSDIYQVGVMLLKSRRLSAAGMSFAQKLKSKTMDAAEDPYLQTLAPMCWDVTYIY